MRGSNASSGKNICCFGLPVEIVSDNGTQFASKGTTEFCEGLKIKQLVTGSQQGHLKRLAKTTGESERQAMILVEIEEPYLRTTLFEPSKNEEELRANLDLL
ncbi:hypothetical protein CR513_31198, partial [Mucuna pruriens]